MSLPSAIDLVLKAEIAEFVRECAATSIADSVLAHIGEPVGTGVAFGKSMSNATQPRKDQTVPTLQMYKPMEFAIADAAAHRLGVETLETIGRDRVDTHTVTVTDLRAALADAYLAGERAGRRAAR